MDEFRDIPSYCRNLKESDIKKHGYDARHGHADLEYAGCVTSIAVNQIADILRLFKQIVKEKLNT